MLSLALALALAAPPPSATENDFDALVAMMSGKDTTDVFVGQPRLLALLGRTDLAREMLAFRLRACADKEEHATPETCARVSALDATLPKASATSPKSDAALLARLASKPLLEQYLEVPAPGGTVTKSATVKIPGAGRVLFAAIEGTRAGALVTSRELDPRGEVSAGGVVAYLSNDAGKTWDGPFHTGFALGFPYFVRDTSTAPLFRVDAAGDVALQVPVDVRAIDPESIGFPPVGMTTVRNKRNVLVRIPLAALTRDSDGDGLTDLAEERLATDRHDDDTDDDGVNDLFDDAPLDASTDDPLGRFVSAALAQASPAPLVVEPGAVMPKRAPETARSPLATRFVGPRTPRATISGRTVRLGMDALTLYAKKLGPIYPMNVDVIVAPNGKRAIVDIDEGWRGTTYLVTERADGTFEVTRVTSWIT